MLRRLAILAGMLIVVSGSRPAGPPASGPVPVAFCPECWAYRVDDWNPDEMARCRTCGKVPVDFEASRMNYNWCAVAEKWISAPCRHSAGQGCSRLEVFAVAETGRVGDLFETRYCPACADVLSKHAKTCTACGRPAVTVLAVHRRWFWCGTEEMWVETRCLADRTRHCCVEREGDLLALPFAAAPWTNVPISTSGKHDLLVTTDWLEWRLDLPELVVVHVGFDENAPGAAERAEYREGHIPGARFLAWRDVARTMNGVPNEMPPLRELVAAVRDLGIEADSRIVLYDTDMGIEAARAFVALDLLGLGENTALLDGHLRKWVAEKRSLMRDTPRVEPSQFLPRYRPEVIVPLEAMEEFVWVANHALSNVTLIDARAEEEYSGRKPGVGVTRPGHVPGAVNLCWKDLFLAGPAPLLMPEDELRSMFEAAGARPGRIVVTYCRTGTEASLTYFASRLLGYDVRLYDGSYVEWNGRTVTPLPDNWTRR